MDEIRYLGVFIVRSRLFKCSLDHAKKSFYRSDNAIFGKVGRLASEEVTLQLIKSKGIPVLLYSLEVCPLNKSDLHSLDFVINRFFMKLFRTINIETVSCCQESFSFALPSRLWNLSFSLIILCIFLPVHSVSVRFVILHIIALYISHLLCLLIQFVLNYYHSHWIKMSIKQEAQLMQGGLAMPFLRTAAHIFVSPGDAPATITQYVARMERQFNASKNPLQHVPICL